MRHPASLFLLPLLLLFSSAHAELVIEGVDGELARNIRAHVSLASEPCDAQTWLIRRRYRSVSTEVKAALEPFGFYEPIIEASLETGDDCWTASVSVDAGPPTLLRNVDISISTPVSEAGHFADLQSPGSLVPGTQLRHSDYENFKKALQIRAAERGFAEASLTANVIDVWPAERAADISLSYETGPRYTFGDITQDQDFLDPALINAFLEFDSGAPFDGRLLTKAYNDLSVSGYFSRIELSPDYERAANEQIPVRVLLEPADRIEYTVGIGFSTDTGPRARAGYNNRRQNYRGHRFKSDLSVSPVIQGITAEYRKPLTDPRTEWQSYTAAFSREDTDTFDDETSRVGVRRTKQIRDRLLRTLSLDVSYDRFTIGEESQDTLLLLPAIAFDHKRADREIFPTRGRRLSVELRGTGEFLGSDTSFLQTILGARFVHSLSSKSRVLARATLGITEQSEFNELPPSVRFFAGGDESVRGFDYNSLGPTDDMGNVIGGSNLLVASLEYEHRLRGNFYGAMFVDAGNAFDDFDVDPAVGAGFGVKWFSPIGPLRFYLAHPLNKSDRTVRVHIRLGADL